MLRGSDVQFHELDEDILRQKLARQRALNKLAKIRFDKLTDRQLERIMKILEEK